MLRRISRCVRKRMVYGFGEASTAAIIYVADTAANYRLIMNYIKSIQDMGLRVKSLGFFETKSRPGFVNENPGWYYCHKADFGLNMKIKSEEVIAFTYDEPDLLIDLSPPDYVYTKYLAGISRAHYKVGMFDTSQVDMYDLLLEVQANISLQDLMKHISHYLQIIKKPVSDA